MRGGGAHGPALKGDTPGDRNTERAETLPVTKEQSKTCLGQQISALGKWGRAQMGSDGFNRTLTGF